MTGIERLRELAGGISQHSVWSVTREEYDNAHGLDVEHKGGQLRDLLADIADQIEREQRRDQASDVSVSAYDLLPADDRDAIAWVREHGGLSHVKDIYHDLRAVVERLGVEWSESELHGLMDTLNRRLMPEGVEWPRYESGEPVRIDGAIADELGCVHEVTSVEIFDNGADLRWNPDEPEECVWVGHGERVRRPTPKVLDAESWERLEDDATLPAATYCERMGIEVEEGCSFVEPMARDIVRRAKALAEVGE